MWMMNKFSINSIALKTCTSKVLVIIVFQNITKEFRTYEKVNKIANKRKKREITDT